MFIYFQVLPIIYSVDTNGICFMLFVNMCMGRWPLTTIKFGTCVYTKLKKNTNYHWLPMKICFDRVWQFL